MNIKESLIESLKIILIIVICIALSICTLYSDIQKNKTEVYNPYKDELCGNTGNYTYDIGLTYKLYGDTYKANVYGKLDGSCLDNGIDGTLNSRVKIMCNEFDPEFIYIDYESEEYDPKDELRDHKTVMENNPWIGKINIIGVEKYNDKAETYEWVDNYTGDESSKFKSKYNMVEVEAEQIYTRLEKYDLVGTQVNIASDYFNDYELGKIRTIKFIGSTILLSFTSVLLYVLIQQNKEKNKGTYDWTYRG